MRFILILFLVFSTSVNAQSYVDEYAPTTYKNFADLMWKYGAHDFDNGDIVKTYFQLTNCPLYSMYYKNDFVWQTIVEGFKRDKRYFSKNIPHKFYIQSSLPIDRYDFKKSAFIIDEEYALDNAGSIQIPFYEAILTGCGEKINRLYFPKKVKFIADRKFALKEIPIRMDDANALLNRIKNYKYENIESDRVIAVRFLITINNLDDYSMNNKTSEIIYSGSLDEIAFFEDPQMKSLIWKKTV